jgi:plastocyanin
MAKQILIALLVVIVAGVGYWLWQGNSTPPEVVETPTTDQFGPPAGTVMEDGVGVGTSSDAPLSATVSYSGSSFSPATVTIKKGGMVTWSNNGDGSMWVASAQHPTHVGYDGTNLEEHCPDTTGASFDQCKGGDSFSFIFNKTGTWRYHDHMNASVFGSVVVVE